MDQRGRAPPRLVALSAVDRVVHELLLTAFSRPHAAIVAEMFAAGHWHGDLTRRTGDGCTARVAVHRIVQSDVAGPLGRVIEPGTDITAPLQADADMRRLTAIGESSSSAVIGNDLNGAVTSWNRAADSMFGYRADEVLGPSLLRPFPTVRVNEESAMINCIHSGNSVERADTVRQHKEDTQFQGSISVARSAMSRVQ